MSVRGWLRRCKRSGHTWMNDRIYAYHGLTPLLRAYSTKAQSLKLPEADDVHVSVQLSTLSAEKLVRSAVDNSMFLTGVLFFATLVWHY